MAVSVFDMFRTGIGPSSSHTVGPMRAGAAFLKLLRKRGLFERTAGIRIDLMGSLAATGRGHGTDTACQLGLLGEEPETCDPDAVEPLMADVREKQILLLGRERPISFDPDKNIRFMPECVPIFHTNAVNFIATDSSGEVLLVKRYYSVGGGFIVEADEKNPEKPITPEVFRETGLVLPHPFRTGEELVARAEAAGLSIAELMYANECARMSAEEVDRRLDAVWSVMSASIERGLRRTETLPGPFRIARRAKKLADDLRAKEARGHKDPLGVLDWVNAYAMAVGEENASGGCVVTAPTNGAAGVIPAVMAYYQRHVPGATPEGIRTFLLTAGAIGILYKENASISGAEVGCQGEVGVACSMAAAGLAAVCGATVHQVENAAEIGMEHNLGLTCDPVAGQVQIPCIERNAIAAVKAINAARMALRGDGTHYVSLDKVIRTMLETGRDMQSKYKETSRGGLAVNIVEC